LGGIFTTVCGRPFTAQQGQKSHKVHFTDCQRDFFSKYRKYLTTLGTGTAINEKNRALFLNQNNSKPNYKYISFKILQQINAKSGWSWNVHHQLIIMIKFIIIRYVTTNSNSQKFYGILDSLIYPSRVQEAGGAPAEPPSS
jgi:hypothetical protein